MREFEIIKKFTTRAELTGIIVRMCRHSQIAGTANSWFCGYVVPVSGVLLRHELECTTLFDTIDVIGGVTFSGGLKHLKEKRLIGFDTRIDVKGEGREEKTEAFVEAEIEKLAEAVSKLEQRALFEPDFMSTIDTYLI